MRPFHFLVLLAALLPFFENCNNNSDIDDTIEKKALQISDALDSNLVKLFHDWEYVIVDTNALWVRISGNEDLYSCSYYKLLDKSLLQIFEPSNFIIDFPCNYHFDTSKYCRFGLFSFRDTIYRISSLRPFNSKVASDNLEEIKDTLIPIKNIFTVQDPFSKFDSLNRLREKLGVHEIYHDKRKKSIIEFRISDQHILTYSGDNTGRGRRIKKNWFLQKMSH